MSCIKSLPEICRLGIARVSIRTLLLVLFTCVMQHTAVLLGNSSTLNKRGEYPPRCNRTTPADFSLANSALNAQTIFSFSAVMAFHEALITSSLSCTIFSDMVYRLLSEWCVATSFYQSSANHVYFYAVFNLRNLLYFIRQGIEIKAPYIACGDFLKRDLEQPMC